MPRQVSLSSMHSTSTVGVADISLFGLLFSLVGVLCMIPADRFCMMAKKVNACSKRRSLSRRCRCPQSLFNDGREFVIRSCCGMLLSGFLNVFDPVHADGTPGQQNMLQRMSPFIKKPTEFLQMLQVCKFIWPVLETIFVHK